MSTYNLTLTNGTVLIQGGLGAGTEDSTTTSLNLVGQNYAGYGILLNENFVKLLENFSNSTAPSNPLVGQIYWNTNDKSLKVWQGTFWKTFTNVPSTPTATPVTGDLYWTGSVMNLYTGSAWTPIGPSTPLGTAFTGILSNSVSDGSTLHTVGNIIVNNKFIGTFSSDNTAFNAVNYNFATVYPGLNILTNVYSPTVVSSNVYTTSSTVTGNANVGNVTTNGITALSNSILYGQVTVANTVNISNSTSSTSTTTGALVITGGVGIGGDLNLTGNIVSSSVAYTKISSGTSAQRPLSPSLGMIRYNSTISSFEGYGAGSSWSSLGGVKSVDAMAYITAEASAGAGDDVLRFYSGSTGSSTQVMWASGSNVTIIPTTPSTSTTTGALQVDGGAGIAGNVNVGANLTVTGVINATGGINGPLTGTITGNVSGSATSIASTNWSVLESGGYLYFRYQGVNKMRLGSDGNLVVSGDITAFGSI